MTSEDDAKGIDEIEIRIRDRAAESAVDVADATCHAREDVMHCGRSTKSRNVALIEVKRTETLKEIRASLAAKRCGDIEFRSRKAAGVPERVIDDDLTGHGTGLWLD